MSRGRTKHRPGQRFWLSPWLYLALSVPVIVLTLFHTWGVGYSLRNRGNPDQPWCPATPEGIPLEHGFGYETSFFPPGIRCSVGAKETGWSDERFTVLPVDFTILSVAGIIALISVIVLFRRATTSRLLSD